MQVKLPDGKATQMGLIVDGVEEVANLTAADIEETPDFGGQISTDYILGMAKVKGTVKTLLDIDSVIGVQTLERDQASRRLTGRRQIQTKLTLENTKYLKTNRSLKLWHYILLAAVIGLLPMTGILLFVIGTSVNKDIDFGTQEMRGNTFQRPLEQLLDLFPRYEAAARKAQAGRRIGQSRAGGSSAAD